MEVISSGKGEFIAPDPDKFREWVRTHKSRELVSKVMSEHDAIAKFVSDGDSVVYDMNYAKRGPDALIREIIRQKKKDLWVSTKYSFLEPSLLIQGGCVSRLDIGWFFHGSYGCKAIEEGKVKIVEWSNSAIVHRMQAGAMGIPFMPVRYLGGTDIFEHSGAKMVKDPYTGMNITLVPALNADVALIHAYQCDEFGNARIFGAGFSPTECAGCAKKVIISTEELISNEDIRRAPGLTTIPHYLVDAVVHLPYGSYPGTVPGVYTLDGEAIMELFMVDHGMAGNWDEYMDKWIYSVTSHFDMLDKRVGGKKIVELAMKEKIKEGFRP